MNQNSLLLKALSRRDTFLCHGDFLFLTSLHKTTILSRLNVCRLAIYPCHPPHKQPFPQNPLSFLSHFPSPLFLFTSKKKFISPLTALGLLATQSQGDVIADAAADYVSAAGGPTTALTAPPSGWSYLGSTAENGGSTVPLTAGQVGNQNASYQGFSGNSTAGTASVYGTNTADPAQFEIFSNGGPNNGVVGSDLLLHPGQGGNSDEFVIVRYTVGDDSQFEAGTGAISGSFRDLVVGGNAAAQSVTVAVYQNSTSLFATTGGTSAQGTQGVLTQADGTFNLTGLTLTTGDTIDFVVGINGQFGADETALNAQISVDLAPPPIETVIADAGGDYVNGNNFPSGWQYLQSNAANGGSDEELLAAGQTVGETGNTGFGGAGQVNSASVLGSIQGGSVFGLYNTADHNGVEGVDLLIQPGNSSDDGFIIARYTVSTADLVGGSNFSISGSFRDEQGGTNNNDSVAVFVYQNSSLLFDASGASGRLFQANGTFDLTNVTLNDGDTIDFVVGRKASFGGDETALQATIERSSLAVNDDAFNVITSSTTSLDVLSNDQGDFDLTTLQVTFPPTRGTAIVQTDGTIEYAHGGQIGNDAFGYSIETLEGTVFSGEVTVIANNGNKTSYGDSLTFPAEVPTGGFTFPDAFPGITFNDPTCLGALSGRSHQTDRQRKKRSAEFI